MTRKSPHTRMCLRSGLRVLASVKMIECCVCSVDVESVGKTCSRKIHGSSCEVEKQYLNRIALECRGVGLNHFTGSTFGERPIGRPLWSLLSTRSTLSSLLKPALSDCCSDTRVRVVTYASFAPIELNQLAFGSLNANQQYTKSVYL